ncbi:Adenylate cyclase [Candidatus Rhodobacter oscarellae]|uniref:Adenylate cyclase n=1 Tax=Candidatus Rhodobacter oscarellae TaxID=1675527 RepID=A0A0J9EA81_9RHOB|nr:winged helix-turn-helix domain-containing protein [Candidatus Rhodobacter lobularis]KMW59687.1 Adenylate cyclase [Candidatus Rhodobacter lobularis]
MNFTLANWQVRADSRTAQRNGTTVTLSPRAMGVLAALVTAQGHVVSRSELLDKVWPDVIVTDESLSQAVAEIRRALQDKGVIATVPKAGYCLAQPVLRDVITQPLSDQASIGAMNLEAHALCLEARNEMVRCGRGSIERADALTAEAVERAPNCPRSRAERSISLTRSHTYWSEGQHRLHEAQSEAQRAIELDPQMALAHSAMGYVLAMAGHWEAAEAAHAKALALDLRDPIVLNNAAWHLLSRWSTRAAVAYLENVSALEPENIKGFLIAAQLCRSFDAARSRRNAERALRRARLRLEADPTDARALSASAVTMALLGEALAAASTLEQIDVQGSPLAIYHASAWAVLGEQERAVTLLEELFDHGWRDTYWLDADPALASLASHGRFQRIRGQLAVA